MYFQIYLSKMNGWEKERLIEGEGRFSLLGQQIENLMLINLFIRQENRN